MTYINPHAALLEYARGKLATNLGQIVRCARLLDSQQLWRRTNAHTNSVGNLILHLCGNVRQWIVGGIGATPIERDRPAEFAERGPLPVEPIVAELERTVQAASDVLARLEPERLGEPRVIQGYETCVAVAVMHAMEHFSFHTGQIVHMTKALCDVDLSLYDEQGRKLDSGDGRP